MQTPDIERAHAALTGCAEYPPKPTARYRLQTARELLSLPPVRWSVKGVLPQNGIAAIYGPSTAGKSFIAIDLAIAVASGTAWFGRKVKASPVTYVCLEGAEGLRLRLEAWKHFHMRELPQRLQFFTLDDFNLLKPGDVMELADVLRAQVGSGSVVVIDTLAQAAPGMDENSGADMSLTLSACKRLQSMLQGLVLLVHHTGKDGSRGMRGHSSLFAAMDAVIEIVRDGDRRGWRVAKAKDGQDNCESYFRLQVIDLGVDDDGDPVTSCIIRPDESPEAAVRKVKLPKGGNQRIVYETLNKLLSISQYRGQGGAPSDRPCVRVDDLIQVSGERLVCDQKRRTERSRQAVTGLVSSSIAELRGEWIWLR